MAAKKIAFSLVTLLLLSLLSWAANPRDEEIVRNAYAKLAYAVQAKTVYTAALGHFDLTTQELNQKLQDNQLRFDISEMSSGALSDIASYPYSDFVTPLDGSDVLQVTTNREDFRENGKRATSNFVMVRWARGESTPTEVWDTPVKDAIAQAGNEGKYSRYVTAAITVRYQGRSRTYRTLWLFGSDVLAIDTVAGLGGVVQQVGSENLFPSVLTDTSLHLQSAVTDWLSATQRFDSSCRTGKQDVCCDSATGRCGVHADDLRSTKPAPTTVTIPKDGGNL